MTEWIVSSIVLIAVVALVRQLLKGKISLRLQYALWAIVLVRLLVPITFGESKISVLNVLDEAASVVEQQEPVEEPTASDPGWEPVGGSPAPIPTAPLMTPGATIAPDPASSELPEPVVPIVPNPGMNSDPVTEPEPPAVDEPVGAPVVTVAQILTALWLCGIAVVGLWFLFTNLRFWLRLRRSRRVLELDCPIRVYVTGAAETPCLFGLIRPAIYLTPEVAEDEVALRHVLAHELTHYHHWDHIWSVLRCVCLAVHWYNPLVWLAASLSRRDAELACDESTIRRIGEEERTAYGRTLIGLTCVHRSNLLHTATTMTGSKKSLKERIVLIAKKPKMAIYTLVAVILIAAIAVGCTFTGAAGTPEKGFLSWVEALKETDFGSTLRAATSKGGLNQDQYARLYDILGTIEEKDFSELPEKFEGLDPNHMIVVGTSLDPYLYIKGMGEEVTKGEWTFYCNDDGTIAVTASYDVAKKYNFDAWRLLDCPELYEFIVELNQDEKVPSDTPQAVLDCAEQVLSDRLAEHIQENGKGDRTELIGLKQHETGTAGLNDAVFIYRITYNLHWDNAFEYHQHYMALGYDSFTDEYTLLDDFSVDELITRYGTEELLAKYDGEMFVAAAMELYQEWLKEEPRRQTVVFEAEILEISESKRLLTVWAYGKKCAVEITKGLEIYGIDGVAITAEELAPGQIIEVTSANQVIYEPVETYGSCYVIRVIQDVGSGEEPADPSEMKIAKYQELLTWDGGTTPYNGALSCVYDSPEDINLATVFYDAFPGGEKWGDFTEEERAYLISKNEEKNLGFGHVEAQKRTAAQLEEVLQAYFGVSLSQVKIPDEWVYYAATDSYYSCHGDVGALQNYTVTWMAEGENGQLYVYYTTSDPIYRQDGTSLDGMEHEMVLTLRIQGSGLTNPHGYTVAANQTLSDFIQSATAAGAEVDALQITVQADGPLAAAKAFVERYGAERVNWPADHTYAVSEFRLLDWRVTGISTDGTALVGHMEYALLPNGTYDNFFVAGGAREGTGEWEGWVLDGDGFMLIRENGSWRCVEFGGGTANSGTLPYHGYTLITQPDADGLYSIQEVVNRVLVGGLMYDDNWWPMGSYTLTSTGADGRVDTYVSNPGRYSSLSSTPGHDLMESFRWKPVNEADWTGMSKNQYALEFSNGWCSFTVYSDENKIALNVNGDVQYFTAEPVYKDYRVFNTLHYAAEYDTVRDHEYALCQVDGSETDYSVIAQSLAEQYAQCILNRPGWAWGQALDVQVKSTEVFDAYYGEENPNFCFNKLLYIKVTEEQRNVWETGSGLGDPIAEGPYAGYYVHGMEVSVRKLEDGNWHMTGMGTGGAMAGLPVPLDNATTQQLLELYFLTAGNSHDWRIVYRLGERPLAEVWENLNMLPLGQRVELVRALEQFAADYPDYAAWTAQDFKAYSDLFVAAGGEGLVFKADGVKAAAEEFTRVYGEAMMEAYGFITDYKCKELEIWEISKDADALVADFRYYVLPASGSEAHFAEEIFTKSEDGWIYANPAHAFLLEQVGDDLWSCTAYGAYSGFTLSEFGYENGMVGGILHSPDVFHCTETDPVKAAEELMTAYLDALKEPADLRSFTITQYRNLAVNVTPTLEITGSELDEYRLKEDEIGENIWIVEISEIEYQWDGVLHDPPCGPSAPPDYWETMVHQGSGGIGFLLTQNGNEFTLQSRWGIRN